MRVRINRATKYVLYDLGISMDVILMFRFKSRWGGTVVSEYRRPQNPRTFQSSRQNSLSGQLKFILKLLPGHAMASLQHEGKKWHYKNWNFWKNQCNVFFSPSNVPDKISISKIKFLFFLWLFFDYWPNYDAKILNFPDPKF